MAMAAEAIMRLKIIPQKGNWRHSGFQVYCGPRIFPQDETAMENLPGTSSGLPSPNNGCSISQNRQFRAGLFLTFFR